MIDMKLLRTETEKVKAALSRRKENVDIDGLLELDKQKREIMYEVEQKKAEQNAVSKKIPAMKKAGEDTTAVFEEMKLLSDSIKELDDQIRALDEKIDAILYTIPNIPNETVPEGDTDEDNIEVRRFMEPTKFDFEPKDHVALAEKLDILDFDRAAKITGARFVVYKGLGARLERALISFMMDLHAKQHGYTELMPPYIVNGASMLGTGQFPKFAEDAYKVSAGQEDDNDWYLNPTAEVPSINMYRDEIIDGDQLPIKFCSYTTAFRAEAGSAGRDTRGILRQHQFNKVELIKFTKPEDSYKELEQMERLLSLLEEDEDVQDVYHNVNWEASEE